MSLNLSNRILTSLILLIILFFCLFINKFLWLYLLVVTSILSFNQINGRGKRGKKWISQAGNIFLSTILQPSLSKKYWHQISLLASFSVFQALIEIGVDKEHLKIKWPISSPKLSKKDKNNISFKNL